MSASTTATEVAAEPGSAGIEHLAANARPSALAKGGAFDATEYPPSVGDGRPDDQSTDNSRRRENLQADKKMQAIRARRRAKGKASEKGNAEEALGELLQKTGLADCRESAARYSKADIGATDLLHLHLADIYRLDEDKLAREPELPSICKLFRLPWTKATRANPGVALFKICHAGISTKRASHYAIALRYCRSMNITADELPKFLKENGGVEGCVAKFRDHHGGSAGTRRSPPKAPLLVINGAPALDEGLHGLVIKIVGGEATYIRNLPPPQPNIPDTGPPPDLRPSEAAT